MIPDPAIYRRKIIRLKKYDYSTPGAYFITICTINKTPFFGVVIDGEMHLNETGRISIKCWEDMPDYFQRISLDLFVIMPNHFHGIINIEGAMNRAATEGDADSGLRSGAIHCAQGDHRKTPITLGAIVRSYKALTSRLIRLSDIKEFGWQANYYEHVIRNDIELNKIREYIMTNPLRWELDRENPKRSGEDDFDQWIG